MRIGWCTRCQRFKKRVKCFRVGEMQVWLCKDCTSPSTLKKMVNETWKSIMADPLLMYPNPQQLKDRRLP